MKCLTRAGDVCEADDPQRQIWYAAGDCGYWTDDWDALRSNGGIPSSPCCGAVGFQADADKWESGAERYAKDDHPLYLDFLQENKGKCFKDKGGFLAAFRKYEEEHSR